ncbi:MAG: CHAT domain-containing protein [Magnetococcales bacterium]|nr:CHAT domain-containing protein [Magnetococcales bacterium]
MNRLVWVLLVLCMGMRGNLLAACLVQPVVSSQEWQRLLADVPDAQRVSAWLRLAGQYRARGLLPETRTILDQARQWVQQNPNPSDQLQVDIAWADYLLGMRQEEEAVQILEQSVQSQKESSDRTGLVQGWMQLGNAYLVQEEFVKAEQAYHTALQHSGVSGEERWRAELYHNLSRLALRQKALSRASRMLEESARLYRRQEDKRVQGFGLLSAGRIAMELAQRAKGETGFGTALLRADGLFVEADEAARAVRDERTRSFALGWRGQLYEWEGRMAEAMSLTRQARFLAQEGDHPESLYLWQWQSGRLLAGQHYRAEAVRHYRAALATLGRVREDVFWGMRSETDLFRTTIAPVYYQLADLLLQEADSRPSGKEQQKDLLEARQAVEALKSAEIQNLFQDGCLVERQARHARPERTVPGTAILYPIVLADRLELLLTLPSGLVRHGVRVEKQRVEEESQHLRQALEDGEGEDRGFLLPSRQLYRWLIDPIAQELRHERIQTLVVVPDGVLRTIPFAALHDGQKFLVEQWAIAVTPGLQLTDSRPTDHRQETHILISALSKGVQGFAPLPNVTREVQRIQRFFPGEVLSDTEFTVDQAMSMVARRSYSMVHIASHGQFDRDPRKTFLLTYDGKLTMDRLEAMMAAGRDREQPVELLTLSACQTAVGDDRAALGLAGVAVKAGAKSVLASLWLIDDEATSLLVSDFYRRLREPAFSKAEALRQAQVQLIQSDRYRHPNLWAPFVLIGNWL